MKVIITMAGAGSRFSNVGINIPKHEIIVNEKTLFEWSMLSLSDFFDQQFIFVVRKGYYNKDFIINQCIQIGIKEYEIVEIDKLTDGQASTVMECKNILNYDDPISIYNIDTYVEAFEIKMNDILPEYYGFIPVFEAEGDKWSFVKLDEFGNVIDVVEKRRISNLGSIGFYYFKRWDIFANIYNEMKLDIRTEFNETYIAPMYKYMLSQGMKIGISTLNSESVHVLGTPEDIEIFKQLK